MQWGSLLQRRRPTGREDADLYPLASKSQYSVPCLRPDQQCVHNLIHFVQSPEYPQFFHDLQRLVSTPKSRHIRRKNFGYTTFIAWILYCFLIVSLTHVVSFAATEEIGQSQTTDRQFQGISAIENKYWVPLSGKPQRLGIFLVQGMSDKPRARLSAPEHENLEFTCAVNFQAIPSNSQESAKVTKFQWKRVQTDNQTEKDKKAHCSSEAKTEDVSEYFNGSRVYADASTGKLIILNASLNDSGSYHCIARLGDELAPGLQKFTCIELNILVYTPPSYIVMLEIVYGLVFFFTLLAISAQGWKYCKARAKKSEKNHRGKRAPGIYGGFLKTNGGAIDDGHDGDSPRKQRNSSATSGAFVSAPSSLPGTMKRQNGKDRSGSASQWPSLVRRQSSTDNSEPDQNVENDAPVELIDASPVTQVAPVYTSAPSPSVLVTFKNINGNNNTTTCSTSVASVNSSSTTGGPTMTVRYDATGNGVGNATTNSDPVGSDSAFTFAASAATVVDPALVQRDHGP